MISTTQTYNGALLTSKAPNLPIAPTDYSQQYMDQVLNALRLYFNQLDNFTQKTTVPDSGTTTERPISNLFVGQTYFDTTLNQLLLWDGTAWVPSTPVTAAVSSFSAGTTGLTPSTATSGAVTLAGTLGITNGGTGLNSIGANGSVLTSNGTSASWVAPASLTGAIQMWPTGTAPTGYLLCNGGSFSTTVYSDLFSVIGYTFGGSGGFFSVPNYTNRMPYGTTVGATGGSADAIVVSHTHTATVSDPGHTHTYQARNNDTFNRGTLSGTVATSAFTANTGSSGTGISVSNSTTGSSGTNANLPPYLGINFIIKT
jgi:microcystin-dependent protein